MTNEAEAQETPTTARAPNAREVLRGFLEAVQIPRLRAGRHREDAAFHARQAADYLSGSHLADCAGHVAWALAHADCSSSKGTTILEAIAARWREVRDALPAGVREAVQDRSWTSGAGGKRKQRAARPVAPGPSEHRQGA